MLITVQVGKILRLLLHPEVVGAKRDADVAGAARQARHNLVTLVAPRVMVPVCPVYVSHVPYVSHVCPFCAVSWDAFNLETLVVPRVMVPICPICVLCVSFLCRLLGRSRPGNAWCPASWCQDVPYMSICSICVPCVSFLCRLLGRFQPGNARSAPLHGARMSHMSHMCPFCDVSVLVTLVAPRVIMQVHILKKYSV